MVTLEDISLEVGCSVNTVSKALNNKPDVSDATRKRVIEAAKRLGYVPNFLAKSLVTKSTGTIGVVVPSVLNPAFAELVEFLANAASGAGYSTFLALSGFDAENETRAVENFYQKRVDGLIVVPVSPRPEYHEMLERFDVPVVYMLDDIQDASSYFVGVDMKEGAALAASRLLGDGRRNLVLLCDGAGNPNSARRMVKGFEAALGQHRQSFGADMVVESVRDLAANAQLSSCDGAVLEHDGLFWPLRERLRAMGRAIPGDVAVASCIGTRREIWKHLSNSVNMFDLNGMAEKAFGLLMRLVKEPDADADARKFFYHPL